MDLTWCTVRPNIGIAEQEDGIHCMDFLVSAYYKDFLIERLALRRITEGPNLLVRSQENTLVYFGLRFSTNADAQIIKNHIGALITQKVIEDGGIR